MRQREFVDDGRPLDGKRFYCSYDQLEEYHAGMWRHGSQSNELSLIAQAVTLLRSELDFSAALELVLEEWPFSCRAEFTGPGKHYAWCGAAACCLIYGVPEELTRRAWWKLDEEQRKRANACAELAVRRWNRDNPRLARKPVVG